MPLVDSLIPEFDHETNTTRRALERVPNDRLRWTPHAKSMSLGALAGHLAGVVGWGQATLTRSEFDLAGSTNQTAAASTAAVLAEFDDIVAKTRAALVAISDAQLMEPWALKQGPQTIFTMPRVAVWRSFVLNHLIHHRGQLSVYLRLLDVAVPAIYGPSADERPE